MAILEIKNLNHIYSPGTPFEKHALKDINLTIEEGEFVALIGHTGSGKSTLVQHLNGLLRPTSGKIYVNNIDITEKGMNLKKIRQNVGLVFQYPEYQLFEESVAKDIAFGPLNLGLSEEESLERVRLAMKRVGLDYDLLKDRSPFELSGGQKRRVAIAGVIAMRPKILVLDEPTAGLDPFGRDEILREIKSIFSSEKITIILVSHSMEDVANLADRMIVMEKGKISMDGTPREIFKREDELLKIGLGIPQITSFMRRLQEKGADINSDCITVQEAKEQVLKYLRSKKNA